MRLEKRWRERGVQGEVEGQHATAYSLCRQREYQLPGHAAHRACRSTLTRHDAVGSSEIMAPSQVQVSVKSQAVLSVNGITRLELDSCEAGALCPAQGRS